MRVPLCTAPEVSCDRGVRPNGWSLDAEGSTPSLCTIDGKGPKVIWGKAGNVLVPEPGNEDGACTCRGSAYRRIMRP